MTDDGLGIGMGMMRIAINDTGFPQKLETTFTQSIVLACGQIATKLVNGDLQDQLGCVFTALRIHRCTAQGADSYQYNHRTGMIMRHVS